MDVRLSLIFIVSLFCAHLKLSAQPPLDSKEKIENYRIALLKERLNLKADQEQLFWNIFTQFDKERDDNRKLTRSTTRDGFSFTASDDELLKTVDKIFELRQQAIEIEKKYKAEFLKVLSIRQYIELQITENKFRQMLIQKLATED